MGLIQMFYMTDIVFSDFVIYVPFFLPNFAIYEPLGLN